MSIESATIAAAPIELADICIAPIAILAIIDALTVLPSISLELSIFNLFVNVVYVNVPELFATSPIILSFRWSITKPCL